MKSSINTKQLRQFSYLVGIGFPLLIGYLIPLMFGHDFRFWTLLTGLPLLFLGLIKPKLLFYPYQIWINLGLVLGWINSRIILGIIFILMVQPISLIFFIFGYDPLKKINKTISSYRNTRRLNNIDFTRIF